MSATKIRQRAAVAALAASALVVGASGAFADAVIRVQSVNVNPSPDGVEGAFEVYVDASLTEPTTTAFQIALVVEGGESMIALLTNVEDTTEHAPLFPGIAFTTFQTESSVIRIAQFPFTPESLSEGVGVVRVPFFVHPNVEGVFPVHIVTLAQDPLFGTMFLDESFVDRLDITTMDGVIRVPAPAGAAAMLGLGALGARRRRRG